MSPIAKLFTVINLVLAGLFVGFAASMINSQTTTLADLKKAQAEAKANADALGADKQKLVTEKAQVEKARDALMNERDNAAADRDRVKNQLDDETKKNADLRTQVGTIAASIENLVASNKQLQQDKDKAQQAQKDAEGAKNAAVAAQLEAEKKAGNLDSELNAAKNSIADLEKTNTSLSKDKKSVETQLASLSDYTNTKIGDFTPMPLIEGAVLGVSYDVEPGLISINRGSDQNVKRGYTFEIYDGKTYKGQARVEYVHPNMCSALIIRTVPGTPKVRQGDSVSTRL
jgi:hypothetical protein